MPLPSVVQTSRYYVVYDATSEVAYREYKTDSGDARKSIQYKQEKMTKTEYETLVADYLE